MTSKQDREIEFQRKCSDFVRQHVHACQSSLVDDLIKQSCEVGDDSPAYEFQLEKIENYYPQKPDEDTDLKDIKAFFEEHGIDEPDGEENPWSLDGAELLKRIVESGNTPETVATSDDDDFDTVFVQPSFECEADDGLRWRTHETKESLLNQVVELMDDGAIDGKREWVDAAERADIDPPEIYEWWIVSDFLERKLKNMGHPVLDNSYGTWWGRCTTGQAISIDHSIREIVRADILQDLGYELAEAERKIAEQQPFENSAAHVDLSGLRLNRDRIAAEIEAWKNHRF